MPFSIPSWLHAASRDPQGQHPPAPPAKDDPQGKEKLWTHGFTVISLSNFLTWLGVNMLITAFPFYIIQLGGDEVTVGIAAATFSVMSLLSRPVSGWLLDNRSRRTALFAGLIGCIIILPLYLIPVLSVVILLRALQGVCTAAVGTALTTNACDAIAPSRFGEGMGMFGLTNSLAMVIGPATGLLLWQHTDPACMFLLVSFFCFISLLMLRRFDFKSIRRHEVAGLAPIGQRIGRMFARKAIPAAVLLGLLGLPGGAVSSFVALYAAESGLGNGGLYFTCQAIGTALMRLFAGKTTDKYGEGVCLYCCNACFFIGLLSVVFAGHTLVFYLGAVLFGMGYGLAMPALQSMCFRTVRPERRGAASATFLCAWDLCFGLGGLLAGLLVHSLSYGAMFCLMSSFYVITVLVYKLWAEKTPSSYKSVQQARSRAAKEQHGE